ncbi:MAG: FMN-binding negative transcriptional regulator [Arenibacterium sp.]
MHPNPAFRTTEAQDNLKFAHERGFGMLCVQQPDAPLLSHVPFLLADDLQSADLHLVRSNPITRVAKEATPAVIAVTGPDSYISPDWYGVPDQVPTWNYIAVHLHGILEPLPKESLLDVLDRQSAAYENRLLPKPPWTTGKMAEEARDRLMRMILPFRFSIERVEGTWKLGQNKDDDVRRRAGNSVLEHGFGSETETLARRMKEA